MNSKRAWPLVALACVVAASATLEGACSGGSLGEVAEQVAAVSQAEVDQPLVQSNTNEPTIVVNPINPANIVMAGFNTMQISTDGGQTFPITVTATLPKLPDGGAIGGIGDSSLAFDNAGNLFWAQLGPCSSSSTCSGLDVYVQQVNPRTGKLVGTAVDVGATDGYPGDSDKEWIAADRYSFSKCVNGLYVAFATSIGLQFSAIDKAHGATSWSKAFVLNDAGDNDVRAVHVAVGADGAVYVAYHSSIPSNSPVPGAENPNGTTGQIIVKRSDDCGQSFPNKWVTFAPGYADLSLNIPYYCTDAGSTDAGTFCRSGIEAGTTPAAGRRLPQSENFMLGSWQPWLLPDPNNASALAVIASDDPSNGQGPDYAGVFIGRSMNEGLNATGVTWSPLNQVDGDNVNSLQLMPTASQDLIGWKCMVASYYDNRNYKPFNTVNSSGDTYLDLFLRASTDEGVTWQPEVRLNGTRFDPDLNAPDYSRPSDFSKPLPKGYIPTNRIGEYNGVAVAHGVAHAVWTGNGSDGFQRIFYNNARMCTDPTLPPPSGNLVAAAQSSSVTSVFAIGSNGTLYRREVHGSGSWLGPSNIGSSNIATPGAPLAVGRLNSNELYVFFVGTDGRLYYAHETNDGAWQTPTYLSAAGFAKSGAYVATGVQSGTQLDVFVVDTNGTLQGFAKQNGSPWSGNIPLANNFAPSGAALATAAHPSIDQLDVFAVGTDGSVVATYVDGPTGAFAPPFSITAANVAFAGNPLATGMQGTDQLDVFYVGRDGAINAVWFVDGSAPFGPLALTPTHYTSGKLSTTQRGTTLNLFTVNASGAAARLWVDGTNAWNGPSTLTINDDAFQTAGTSAAPQGSLTDLFILGNVYLLETTFDGTSWSSAIPLLP